MKILHVDASLSRAGAGLSEAVAKLAREAAKAGCEVTIATVARKGESLYPAVDEALACRVRVLSFAASQPLALYFSCELWTGLRQAVADADVVHVHSNWTFPVWRACSLALALRKPLIMSPHGCLNVPRLRHSMLKKRLAGWLFDRRYLRAATIIHATSQVESDAVAVYIGERARARIAVVPLGVDIPSDSAMLAATAGGRGSDVRGGARRVLFLGRQSPLKGLDLLVAAWAKAVGRGETGTGQSPSGAAGWRLVIAGEDENGGQRRLVAQARACGLSVSVAHPVGEGGGLNQEDCAQVVFAGPVYGRDKEEALATAAVFVLPTRDENFGLVVAEALAHGVPVITTKGAPWSELQGRCGWWVDIGVEPLAEALREAMSLSDAERHALGLNGRKLVERKYRWGAVAERLLAIYSGLAP